MKKLLTFLLGLASGIALIFMIFKKFFDLVDKFSKTDDHLKSVAFDQFIPALNQFIPIFKELLISTMQCMLYGKSSHTKIKKLHNYRNIYVRKFSTVNDIIKNFNSKISEQGYVTVAELCEMSGIDTIRLTDECLYKKGWTEYDDIDYIKQGDYDIYKIILTDPKFIEDLTY